MKRFLPLLLAAILLCSAALGEIVFGWSVEDAGVDLDGGSLHYPKLTGGDADAVNSLLADRLGLYPLLDRITLNTRPTPITAVWTCSEAALADDVFSCVLSVSGPVETARSTHQWRSFNFDLRTGRELAFEDLFRPGAAAEAAEEISSVIDESITPFLSPMLDFGDLLAFGDQFTVDEGGLTLYYPITSYETLSGHAGSLLIRWSEIAELIDPALASRIGMTAALTGDAAAIRRFVSAGTLPGIPARLGDTVGSVLTVWPEEEDPDLCDYGLSIVPEGAPFRQRRLICSAMGDYTQAPVTGLRADCIDFRGLITGKTTAAEWRALLGAPDHTVAVDADLAEANRLLPGESDYYLFGGHTLRLHADADGVLVTVLLLE